MQGFYYFLTTALKLKKGFIVCTSIKIFIHAYSKLIRYTQQQAFIELQKEGLIKNIGISNFNEYQISRIIKETNVVPSVHQIEIHPYLINQSMVDFCQSNKIAVTAYSPLGSPDRPW